MNKKISELIPIADVSDEKTVILDVRSILDSGKDPLPEIMKILSVLDDKTLLIINSFEPIPLIELLKGKGFEFTVEKKDRDLFYTYFKNSDQKTQEQEILTSKNACFDFWDETLLAYEKKTRVLNVRNLDMPWPMIQVLNALTQMDPGNALHILHRKIPYLLMNELSKRGYACKIKEEGSDVQLLIFKEK